MSVAERTVAVFGTCLFLVASACSVTVGALEGSSESFANTTDSAGEFAEASTEFTSSTSPRGGESPETAARRREAATRFAASNFRHLRRDLALGSGEYVEAIAALLGVAPPAREEFYRRSKVAFSAIVLDENTKPAVVVDRLDEIARVIGS